MSETTKKATIGRIVEYNMTPDDQNQAQGSLVQKVPAVIVSVHNDTLVNLKVFTDGPTDFWLTSVVFGDEAGKWNWPEIK
jgi:hypothetical protein